MILAPFAFSSFSTLLLFIFLQLSTAVGAPRQTNGSTRPRLIRNLRSNTVETRKIRHITKQRVDATVDHYDGTPPMEEQFFHAQAIFAVNQKAVRPQQQTACAEEKIEAALAAPVAAPAAAPVLGPPDAPKAENLDDSFELMFESQEDDWNSQYDMSFAKRQMKTNFLPSKIVVMPPPQEMQNKLDQTSRENEIRIFKEERKNDGKVIYCEEKKVPEKAQETVISASQSLVNNSIDQYREMASERRQAYLSFLNREEEASAEFFTKIRHGRT